MTATTKDRCGITCGIENDKATPNAWNGFGNGETMLTTLMHRLGQSAEDCGIRAFRTELAFKSLAPPKSK